VTALDPDSLFLAAGADAANREAYLHAVSTAASLVADAAAAAKAPTSPLMYSELAAEFKLLPVCPPRGVGLDQALTEARDLVLAHTTVVGHAAYAAHLHCPPLLAALAAEVLISATNQSLDSFDQGPSATAVECRVVEWLCELAGFPGGDGVFTSGATQSNTMGLLLARDRTAQSRLGWPIARSGLPPQARTWRVLCAPTAHFSVAQALSVLGLGDEAVLEVGCDRNGRMDVGLLRQALADSRRRGDQPIALVLTAGTTDLGAVDPLREAAAIAHVDGLWVHVDAAAGGALLLSRRHGGLLDGLDEADSVALDPHKLLFQPVSCGVFLTRDAAAFELIRRHADYLNPLSDEQDGTPDLVRKSLQTTRRFDALKVLLSLRALGGHAIAELIDATVAAAHAAAGQARTERDLELIAPVATNTVALRWIGPPGTPRRKAAEINSMIQRSLAREGRALIGRSTHHGEVSLKLTFVNPLCTPDQAAGLVRAVAARGSELAEQALAVKADRTYGEGDW
jgi:L-2,4-diaminobutyrate decarboxylase